MSDQDDGPVHTAGAAAPAVAALHRTDVAAISDRLFPLRRQLTDWAVATGMAAEQVEALILATDEAMSNAVLHAYELDRPGTFELHATHHPDQHTIDIVVRDHGRWQPPISDPGPLHGRGLILIRALAHEASIEQTATGTTVRMTWLLT